jgi:hypothetical protein
MAVGDAAGVLSLQAKLGVIHHRHCGRTCGGTRSLVAGFRSLVCANIAVVARAPPNNIRIVILLLGIRCECFLYHL